MTGIKGTSLKLCFFSMTLYIIENMLINKANIPTPIISGKMQPQATIIFRSGSPSYNLISNISHATIKENINVSRFKDSKKQIKIDIVVNTLGIAAVFKLNVLRSIILKSIRNITGIK